MCAVPQECTHDLLAALRINADAVAKDVLLLKGRAREQACDWLHQFCRGKLEDILASATVPCQEEQLRETLVTSGALLKTDCREPRWHLLYVDILLAKGEMETLRRSPPAAPKAPEERCVARFGGISPVTAPTPVAMIRLQVRIRQRVRICGRCLARSPETQRPRPGWAWWRLCSTTTPPLLVGSAGWLGKMRPPWPGC